MKKNIPLKFILHLSVKEVLGQLKAYKFFFFYIFNFEIYLLILMIKIVTEIK